VQGLKFSFSASNDFKTVDEPCPGEIEVKQLAGITFQALYLEFYIINLILSL
jgi:hypothetical protein